MAGVAYTMATEIAINTVGAQQSIKGLNSALSSAVNSMKAGIAQANSTGDSLGAMKNKVDGLEQVMGQLQAKIDVLKDKQSGLDTKTQEGAEAYLKLQKQIEQSENRLASYSAQQDRAKESMGYYKSGLADLQHGYQMTIDKTEAYSNRLKAEGDDLGALKAKLNGYKEAMSNLNQQYEKQSSELKNNESKVKELSGTYSSAKSKLDEMASAGQKNSNEYKDQASKVNELKLALNRANDALDTQKIRVDKTGTSAAETKSKINSLNNEIKDVNPTPFQRLKNKITEAGDAGHKSESIFKSVFTANLGANAVIGIWTSLTSHIGEATKAGMEYDKEQQKMVATWTTLTGKHKDAQIMVDDVNKLSVATGQSAQQTDELEQKFYHLHSSKDEAHDMTKAMLNMADAVGLNGQQIDAVSQDMTNALSRGKASAGEINQITQYFPMYREELAKSKNVTVEQLNDMVKHGKVSADDMEKVFEHLGNVKYGKAAENMLSTMTGAERTIKARMPQLIGDIEKPLMEAKNPMYLAVSKWASDPATDKEFKKLGKATSDGINTITAAFTKNFKPEDMAKGLNGVLDNMANSVTKFSKSIAGHSKEISEFFGNFKSGSVNTIKLFAGVMSDLAKVTIPLLGFMASHSKVFSPLIAGMIAMHSAAKPLMLIASVSKITGIAKAINSLVLPMKLVKAEEVGIGLAFKMNPIGMVVTGVTLLIGALVLAYNKIKPFHDAVNKLGRMIVDVFKGVIDFFKNNWKQIGLFIMNPFAGIASMLYKNVKPFRDFTNSALNIIKSGFGAIGNFFSGFWNGTVKVFNAGIKLVTNVWNSGWNFAKNIVVGIFNGISSFFGGVWNGIKSIFSVGLNFVSKIWSSEWNEIKNVGVTIWNFITSFIGGFWNGIKNVFNSSLNFVLSIWTNSWNAVSNVGKSIWNGITSFVGGFWNGFKNIWNSSLNWISNIWNNSWNGIFNFGKGIWNGISSFISNFWNGIKSLWNDSLNWIKNKWSDVWDGIVNIVHKAIEAVHHKVVDLARGVIRPINDMLKGLKEGINWVLDKVGADKISAKWEISMPAYAKGTGNTHPGGLAKVNDSPTSNFREMYQLPNGQVGMFPNERNMVVNLPKGTSVLDGNRSAMLAKSMNIPAYKDGIGGMIDSITNTVTGVFKGIWDKGADIVDMADDIIKKPAEFLSTVFEKFVGIKDSKIGLANDVITKFPKTVAKEGMKWVKDLFTNAQENGGGAFGDAGSGRGAPGGGGAARWHDQIKAALAANGASTDESMIQKWIRQVNTESGGNERAIGGNDGLSDGNAMGLVQVKPGTFRANAFPGHGNMMNGYDSLLAGIHYAIQRYGKGMGFIGNGHGYANGGYVGSHQMIEIAEGNKGEFVIPTDPAKRPRAEQLLGQVVSQFASDGASTKPTTARESALEDKVEKLTIMVDKLVDLHIQSLQAQKGTTKAVYDTSQTPHQRYIQDAQNNTIHDYQFGGA